MFTCERCLFLTDKISNYERHLNSKKHLDLFGPGGPDKELEEQHQAIENNNTDNNPEEYACKKCAKLYKGKTFLIEHEKTCIGIDSLTCPRCMKTFSHKANKAKHIKINNCKPRSIFKYLEEKQKRLEESKKANPQTKDNNTVNSASTTTVHHTDSTETVSPNQINTNNLTHSNHNTITNNNIVNHIYINNYGNERLDYVTSQEILDIIKGCDNDILPKYIVLKHFNPEFPENKNIQYKNNMYLIKTKDAWNIISSDLLASKLYSDNGCAIGRFCLQNDEAIDRLFQNVDLYEYFKQKTNFNEMCVKGEDKNIKQRIKDVVKTHNTDTRSMV